MQDTAKRIGARFLTLRRRLKYTQEQVAEKSGINSTYYGRVERGEANISLELLVSIANTLGVSLSELLDIEPEKDRAQLFAEFRRGRRPGIARVQEGEVGTGAEQEVEAKDVAVEAQRRVDAADGDGDLPNAGDFRCRVHGSLPVVAESST